ncbi:CLUMA_CG002285, isoform A [Clunio marinus]|uniref:CLUMA_CG002285, isoform A n=1 Tax=Clunio marinus TaxID=568069 RepID=A0A1J1HK79_9DIPT|nr:CLUMA_CG002285, isoform A [Clunio marinus]
MNTSTACFRKQQKYFYEYLYLIYLFDAVRVLQSKHDTNSSLHLSLAESSNILFAAEHIHLSFKMFHKNKTKNIQNEKEGKQVPMIACRLMTLKVFMFVKCSHEFRTHEVEFVIARIEVSV